MNLSWRFVQARWVLATALMKDVLLRPLMKSRSGSVWLAALSKERLGVTPPEVWQHGVGAGRCIGCGACDIVAGPGETPSAWIMGALRSPQDAALEEKIATRLIELAEPIARVCPTQVDVKGLGLVALAQGRVLVSVEAAKKTS